MIPNIEIGKIYKLSDANPPAFAEWGNKGVRTMKKTTQEEAVSQINDLQNCLSLYQNQGVSFDDMPLVLEKLEDAIMFARVLFFEYVYEEGE